MKFINTICVIGFILIAASIFLFSAQEGVVSMRVSDSVNQAVLNSGSLNDMRWEHARWTYSISIRKWAHLILYGTLGFFAAGIRWRQRKWWVFSLGICLLYSVCDELHQLFVQGREALISDIIFDMIGTSVGLTLFCFLALIVRLAALLINRKQD